MGEGVWGFMVAVGGEVVCVHGWGVEVWVCGYGCWCVGVVCGCGLCECVWGGWVGGFLGGGVCERVGYKGL